LKAGFMVSEFQSLKVLWNVKLRIRSRLCNIETLKL